MGYGFWIYIYKGMPKNPKFPHLIDSKWTAQQPVLGWRHFQVVNHKKHGQWVFAEMSAACEPSTRFWLNAQLLKDRTLWQAGWKSLQEM
jgi:tryptophan-rich hypothetical protein